MKLAAGFALGLAFAFIVTGIVATGEDMNGLQKMEDGSYRIYAAIEMYDGHTGEPVYWLVGGRMNGQTEPGKYHIYTIGRSKLRWVDVQKITETSPQVEVRNGVAALVSR